MATRRRGNDGKDTVGPAGGDRDINAPINFAAQAARRGKEPYYGEQVSGGGGTEPPENVDVRIAKLETHVYHIQSTLTDIKTDLSKLVGTVSHLPTKQDLTTNIAVIVTIGLTVVAIIVGSMGWLETRASRVQAPSAASPQPIIIQVPTAPASSSQPMAIKPKR